MQLYQPQLALNFFPFHCYDPLMSLHGDFRDSYNYEDMYYGFIYYDLNVDIACIYFCGERPFGQITF